MSNINTFLTKIQALNKENIIKVNVPSLSAVEFLPLSVKQQKDLIKSSLDGSLAGILINNTINDIINENNVNKVPLLVTDKLPIVIALRIQAFGSLYKTAETTIDLANMVNRPLVFNTKSPSTINYKDIFSIDLKVPTLDEDTTINNTLIQQYKNNTDIQISDVASNLYVVEITKFLRKITINSETIDFTAITDTEKQQIVEQLPVQLNQLVLDFISNFRTTETKYLTIGETEISIDTQFFTKE